MKKPTVILWMAMSVNGMIAAKNNNEDFLTDANWHEFVKAVQKSGCLIWGRITHETVNRYPARYRQPLTSVTKVVISKNKNLKLNDNSFVAASPRQAINFLQKQGFKQIILVGGAKNNTAFAKANLIDEVKLNLEAAIIGQGLPLFDPNNFSLKLAFEKIRKITPNIIQLCYRVKK